MTEKPRSVLYVDLDGTVRHGLDELGRFVSDADDVVIFDGVTDRLWRYKKAGWRIIAVTNQGGVALGHLSMRQATEALRMTQRLTREAFDRVVMCVHHPEAKDPEMAVCWCRKPRIGGLVEAALGLARQFGEYYPPHLGLFVGDRLEDEQCAQGAGLKFMSAKEWRERGEP
jgi:D-glycero-D-manno-heptose 1,7-bisphosphate phosphatase